jgi:DNA-3-methyladenine glycosylase II
MKKQISFNDKTLDKLTGNITLPKLTKTKDIYLDMLEVIISQQLSGRVAKVIFDRFLELFDDKYPNPKILIGTDDSLLRGVGLSNAKSKYVKNLAEFATRNNLSTKHIDTLNDKEIIDLLTQIKGIGKWSVEMILMFSLKRPDVFPYDDLVIKKSMIDVYGLKEEGTKLIERMETIANKWRPNRSLASRYLWAHYGIKNSGKKK